MDKNKLNKKYKVLKVRDKNDNNVLKQTQIFDVPMRLLLCGASGSGKSQMLVNLLLNTDFPYSNIYSGENIFIFAPAPYSDNKMKLIIDEKEVPSCNIFDNYSDDLLEMIYDSMVEEYEEDINDKNKPSHKLFILDDLSFTGSFSKRFNALGKVYQNGRKFLVSVICLSQYYRQVSPAVRMNSTGLILFRTPNSQIDSILDEHNYIQGNKKKFLEMWFKNVKERHDYIVINYSNNSSELYLDKNFENITPTD